MQVFEYVGRRQPMSEAGFGKQSRVLRTLAHPGRLAILAVLGKGEACVCHLAAALGRTQPYVSQQLAVLKAAGFLTTRRQGTFTYYTLRDFSVLGIVDLTDRLAGNATLSRVQPGIVTGCDCPRCRLTSAEEVHVQ
jgi:ArsR family transcriptional regulator